MDPRTKALLDLQILLGNAAQASISGGEDEEHYKGTLIALRDKITATIAERFPGAPEGGVES